MWSFVIEAATGAGEAQTGLPQLDVPDFAPQLVWLAISFAVLYLILSRVALPRVSEVIEERRDRIERDLEAAGRLKAETEQALAEYEAALASARGRAHAMAKETRDGLAAEAGRERARMEGATAAKVGEAEARIAASKSRALAGVEEIARDTAGAIVGKLLGEGASPDEIRGAFQPEAAE